MSKAKESVTEHTFKSWPFASKFDYKRDQLDGKVYDVVCKVCSTQWEAVEMEAKRRRLRGASLKSMRQYVDGVNYVHRSNLERHLAGDYHLLAEGLNMPESKQAPAATIEGVNQPRIDRVLIDKSEVIYTRYFRTALWLALEELPTTKFGRALELQRKNGLPIPPGKESRQTGQEMISILADTLREDIMQMLAECNFMSGLSDGSEARKTREEKELVYVKFVYHGVPTILLLKCQRMIDFGGTDAAAILKSIRDAFLAYKVDISTGGKHIHKLISMCADGASCNMGCKRGALTVLKEDVNWLVIVHCSLHKLELAMKDGFKSAKDFELIDEHMLHLYQTFKTSGKCWRVLLLLASKIGVGVRRFAKSQGTRFQAHKKNALDVLLYNFGLLLLFAENASVSRGLLTPGMKTRFQGFHKKWLKYEYPVRVSFYREVLSTTSKLSLMIERDDVMLPDIIDSLEDCSDSLEDLLDDKWQELPGVVGSFSCTPIQDEDGANMTVTSTNLPSTLSLMDHKNLSERQKKNLEKCMPFEVSSSQQFQLMDMQSGKQAIARIQTKLIPEIKECIDSRFTTLKSDPLIQAMRIIDQTTWDYSEKEFGNEQLQTLAVHYEVPLQAHAFQFQHCLQEWRQLLKIAKRKYASIKNKKVFWEKIFSNESSYLPNVLLIVDICLSVAWAQGMVERGFSLTRRLITDARTSLKNTTLDNLLVIRLNVPVLSKLDDSYEEKLVKKAVSKYTEKRRWSLGTSVKRRKSKHSPGPSTSAMVEEATVVVESSDETETLDSPSDVMMSPAESYLSPSDISDDSTPADDTDSDSSSCLFFHDFSGEESD